MIFILGMLRNIGVLLGMCLGDFGGMIRSFIIMFVNMIVIFVIEIDVYMYMINSAVLLIYK
jgi:hypothetical protein